MSYSKHQIAALIPFDTYFLPPSKPFSIFFTKKKNNNKSSTFNPLKNTHTKIINKSSTFNNDRIFFRKKNEPPTSELDCARSLSLWTHRSSGLCGCSAACLKKKTRSAFFHVLFFLFFSWFFKFFLNVFFFVFSCFFKFNKVWVAVFWGENWGGAGLWLRLGPR